MEMDSDAIRSGFSPEEQKTHALIRELLWMFYPQDKDSQSIPSEDTKADEAATFIVEALKNNRKACME